MLFEIVLLFGILSKQSFGLPIKQLPVDHDRPASHPLSSNFSLSNPAPESTRIYTFRAGSSHPTHHPPNAGDSRPNNNPHSFENIDHHGQSQNHHDDHDVHKVHKLSKLNIQQHITQRDIEKHKSNESVWKKYFAEMLAAFLLVVAMIVFLCWYNYTKVERQRRSGAGRGPGAREKRRMHRQNTFQRGQSMPELYINVSPIQPLPQNPKSSCICSPEEPKRGFASNHSWNYHADVFDPLTQAAKV